MQVRISRLRISSYLTGLPNDEVGVRSSWLLTPLTVCVMPAQDDGGDMLTLGRVNGRGWQASAKTAKIYYLKVFFEGTALVRETSGITTDDDGAAQYTDTAKGFVIDDYMKELDKIYNERENIRIPAVLLLVHCTKKFSG